MTWALSDLCRPDHQLFVSFGNSVTTIGISLLARSELPGVTGSRRAKIGLKGALAASRVYSGVNGQPFCRGVAPAVGRVFQAQSALVTGYRHLLLFADCQTPSRFFGKRSFSFD